MDEKNKRDGADRHESRDGNTYRRYDGSRQSSGNPKHTKNNRGEYRGFSAFGAPMKAVGYTQPQQNPAQPVRQSQSDIPAQPVSPVEPALPVTPEQPSQPQQTAHDFGTDQPLQTDAPSCGQPGENYGQISGHADDRSRDRYEAVNRQSHEQIQVHEQVLSNQPVEIRKTKSASSVQGFAETYSAADADSDNFAAESSTQSQTVNGSDEAPEATPASGETATTATGVTPNLTRIDSEAVDSADVPSRQAAAVFPKTGETETGHADDGFSYDPYADVTRVYTADSDSAVEEKVYPEAGIAGEEQKSSVPLFSLEGKNDFESTYTADNSGASAGPGGERQKNKEINAAETGDFVIPVFRNIGGMENNSDSDVIQERFEGTGFAPEEKDKPADSEPSDDYLVGEVSRKITYVADIPDGGELSDCSENTMPDTPDSADSADSAEPAKPAHPLFEDKYGIQERFDITFLDDEITESTRSGGTGADHYVPSEYGYGKGSEEEDEDDAYRGTAEADAAYDGAGGYPEEKELSDKKDKDEFAGFDGADISDGDSPEETEIPSETDELLENNNDIWDDDDREFWTEHDRFIELCRSLNVPPLKISKHERRPSSHSGTEKVKSSGYRYEMVERLPFDEGMKVEDREAYSKREKAFCEDRAERYGRKLRDKQRMRGVKTWVVGIAALLCLVLDCLNFVSVDGARLVSSENIMMLAGAEIFLALVGTVIVFDCIADGLRCAARGVFIPELFTVLAAVSTLIYHGAMMLFAPLPDNAVLLGAPALAIMFITELYRYYLEKRELKAFEVTSSYGAYCTEVKLSDFRSTPECAEFEGYADRESSLYRINRVSRIDGCYNEQPLRDECFGMMRILFLCVICASLVCGIVFGLIGQSVYNGLLSAFTLILCASPVSVFVSMFLPRFRAAERAAEDGSAIIGFDEESEEFDENVIMIDENDLYPAENVTTKIEVCNLPGIEGNVMRTAALFRKLGGTLGYMFGGAELDDTEKVELLEISEHGVTANVGKSLLRAGNDKYLKKFGIKVARYDGELGKSSRVLYVADDGEFFCRIIMTFKPDEELCHRISDLRTCDTLVSLKSCNPCIDTALVFYTTGLEPELLKNIKYSAGDDVSVSETDREGVLVSRSGAVGIFTALIEYKRQKKLVFYGSRLAGFTCAAGAAAALALSVIGGGAAVSLIALAVQAVFCGIAGVAGSRGVSGNAVKVKKK